MHLTEEQQFLTLSVSYTENFMFAFLEKLHLDSSSVKVTISPQPSKFRKFKRQRRLSVYSLALCSMQTGYWLHACLMCILHGLYGQLKNARRFKGAITSEIKHAIKLNTSPAKLA